MKNKEVRVGPKQQVQWREVQLAWLVRIGKNVNTEVVTAFSILLAA